MYLDPTNDIAFKRIFGNEDKKEILISFLNSVLHLKNTKKIKKITFLNPFQAPQIIGLKYSILDVKCKDQRDIEYIVEMQLIKAKAFAKRVQYYVSKSYSNQIEEGDKYPELNQVIFLGILDFEMFENKNYISNHLILDVETLENTLRDLVFYFIELPKFNKKEEELETIEDKWLYFLKEAKHLEIMPKNVVEEEIKNAYNLLDKYGWTKEELDLYDRISIAIQDERGRIEQALIEGIEKGIEKGLEKGREEGLEKGREEGLEKGREEGLKEGLEKGERRKAIEIAKKLLKNNLDISIIITSTGLSENEINKEIG